MRPVVRFLGMFGLVVLAQVPVPSRSPNKGQAQSVSAPILDSSYTLFESGLVRPLAISPDGSMLFAVNNPDNRLEVFRITRQGLKLRGSIAVGLEPVAVAARTDREVWVVNHLSDSVSIVELSETDDDYDDDYDDDEDNTSIGRVVRTLLVGDEPRDIVFGGPAGDRAFVTTAHRGQNVPYDPQFTTPGVGRADVWVFDAHHLGQSLEGEPLAILQLFCDTPRALAVSPDGRRVYAAGFLTGNQTTTVFEMTVSSNGGLPRPRTNSRGIAQPRTGLIVKHVDGHWVDEDARVWDEQVRFSLPDRDVFVIDAAADPPALTGDSFQHVGTVLFNMIVNPANGHVYVTNTEAFNEVRFEGAGRFLEAFGKRTVQGHLVENRITVLTGHGVLPRRLNKHIDFTAAPRRVPNPVNAKSLAIPTDLALTQDGGTLYVAAFGSGKVGVYETRKLEDGTFIPDEADQIGVSGGGPAGLALDEERGRLYVLTRFDNSISIVNIRLKKEIAHVPMHNPEPEHILRGRRFLYDAAFTSSNGSQSCAVCHVFGDFDGLAWDLGDPDGVEITNNGLFFIPPEPFGVSRHFRPMKGPMTTQSLRGLANHGAMHWRGDRLQNRGESVQPDTGAFDENTAFNKFNVAFVGLNGRAERIPATDMQAFTDFALEITYPPNPIRNLDDSLRQDQQAGRDFFFGERSDLVANCTGCHLLDRQGNSEYGVPKPGFFGTDGRFTFENEPQIFKVPHLRNLYQKVGMFGMAGSPQFFDENHGFKGDQIRGFGYIHDGSVDTLFRFTSNMNFLRRPPLIPGGFIPGPAGLAQRRQVVAFLLAFDSNLKPIVGQQVTLGPGNWQVVAPRLHLMMARAEAGDCELVGKRGARGYLYRGRGRFATDRAGRSMLLSRLVQRARGRGGETTFTCVPPGSGIRIGLDRDGDRYLDGDEQRAGTDPADPSRFPRKD